VKDSSIAKTAAAALKSSRAQQMLGERADRATASCSCGYHSSGSSGSSSVAGVGDSKRGLDQD
jgi:hypothetical protein